MSDEKSKLLQMVRDGKISVEEGAELLDAMDEPGTKPSGAEKELKDRFLRVHVDSAEAKVNVNIPLSLLKVASRLGNMIAGLIPGEARREMAGRGLDLSKIDFEELMNLINQGLEDGKLVDVDIEDPVKGRIRVEIYVE
ncbi:SHOCT-like domain-containing protein [Desulfotomaculum copahuensis]|uniref:YvlB/LiaX N-terminal domain-containing protein n=1 Tax=Desulfotomaculum copahuensis TaxID=1838280 RepID=A0A1B7LKX9_9FIRM|nr:hypothetical protein [Desulfotomaculum copahuensis]OAT87122.1 hypothetical protein A6M21_02215 [Desulfotomaculum copahuensis]